uniref:Cation-transporting P-type ATPase N-terminal domain-containing protein n=1 Tax=Globisporangium ultimum (strain ATCC 200006 / CBS 805.95 / DAOM BR144) TaxID=431595 RepID=K3WH59_GLOUD
MANEKSPLLGDDSSYQNGNGAADDERFYMGVDKRSLYDTPESGLSTVEAARRLKVFGPNELATKEKSPWVKLAEQFWGPMPIMIWLAIFVELLTKDMPDFFVLLFLQILNGTVGWYEELKAGNAVAALKASLKPEALVIRDGVHQTINAALLVPGDRVTLAAGSAVPADCDLCEGNAVQIDQAALTGESFPVTMVTGDNAKMGSTVTRGEIEAVVTATGSQTFFGKTASLISSIQEAVEAKVLDLARRGIRSLAVGRTDETVEGGWIFLGIMTFLDPPRHDTKHTIEMAHANGIGVKMITGDQAAIAVETCRMLGMGTTILGTDVLPTARVEDGLSSTLGHDFGAIVESADGFAQVFPEHKFLIVEILRQRGWVCGMTGDGVNDAPALKKADVGIAVEGSTDAARAAADIVLTKPGLSVIINAITLSRKIFQRMRNYVTYRIACTIQLLLFFFISVLLFHPDSCRFPHFVPHRGDCPYNDNHGSTEAVDPYFKLPVIALVLITILNDGTIISIAYDNVVPSKRPETWNLPRIYWISTTLGVIAVASSLLILFWGLDSWNEDGVLAHFGLGNLPYDQVMMMMYLKISLSDFMTVFTARTESYFFTRAPGRLLAAAALFATVISTLLAIFWPFTEMQAISPKLALFVWIYCLGWFFVQDIGKVVLVFLLERAHHSLNVYDDKVSSKKFVRQETMRQNRIRLGASFVNSESSMRDSFVAGRAVRSSYSERSMTLEQAMDRLARLENEMKMLRQVIQSSSGVSNQ